MGGAAAVMAQRSTSLQLPAPEFCVVASGATVWVGGVHTLGNMVCAPGRYTDDLGVARAHAAAILAACDAIERGGG